MTKTILLTGATDGIGLETAKMLNAKGHHVLLHGRDPAKLDAAKEALSQRAGGVSVETYLADLSDLNQVTRLADAVTKAHKTLDVLINNAGVFKTPTPTTGDGLDIRFVVNTLAPFHLTEKLLALTGPGGRILNVSSAAQAPVNLYTLTGAVTPGDDFSAYAQSKLALTMWSRNLSETLGPDGPVVVAINPGSLLGTKMVREGFGTPGKDIGIGADILVRAALSPEFDGATGRYYDNDAGRFGSPHPDALNAGKCADVVAAIRTRVDAIIA